ncbi:MAG: glycoside hydrolase family 28 protein [Bacteroidetes bacterium]|nr:glycoside hydrolase family 28 protein [Bacteroidota bacterium]
MKRLCNTRTYLVVWLFMLVGSSASAQQYNIKDFGAVGDGKTDNTSFIQKAIDTCARTGGKVIVPQGSFLTATLYLKSNTTLYLEGGATLLGHPDIRQYPYLDAGIAFYGDQWARQALLFCKNAENVTIEGQGTIDGQGASFPVTTDKKPDRYKNRPYLLWFAGSRNITIRNVSLRNSAFWMQHYLVCEHLYIDGIKVWNHSNKNNDLMDIDGCRYVSISNVTGDSDDDGITIKSTSPSISENITIANCTISSHCNALKFGTESTGGFRNITVTNCVIKPSRQLTTIYGKPAGNSGLSMELVDGGIMENVTVNNLIIEGPQVPLFVRLGNRARKHTAEAPAPPMGRLSNIRISNIIARDADETGCSFSGLENAPIENIFLDNIYIETKGGGKGADTLRQVDELPAAYPEATMFGQLPAYGMYIRHARAVHLSNITLAYKTPDTRPGIAVIDTDGFSYTGMDIRTEPKTEKIICSKTTLLQPAVHSVEKRSKKK